MILHASILVYNVPVDVEILAFAFMLPFSEHEKRLYRKSIDCNV